MQRPWQVFVTHQGPLRVEGHTKAGIWAQQEKTPRQVQQSNFLHDLKGVSSI